MELDCETDPTDEVTLVTARLRNERATDRRVRLTNRLDGPVLPPRRNGEPERGWDREGVTTVVPAGERVALGYACPADPESPPVTVAWVDAPDGDEENDSITTSNPVTDAMWGLGDARPPRAALPDKTGSGNDSEAVTAPTPATTVDGGADECPTKAAPPSDAETVLRPHRERIETVEALEVASVQDAADLLETNGGLAGVEALGTALDADAAALRALAAEATALAVRAETATPPTETIRRLS